MSELSESNKKLGINHSRSRAYTQNGRGQTCKNEQSCGTTGFERSDKMRTMCSVKIKKAALAAAF